MSHQNISHLTGWRRCIGCLIFIGHFAQKSTMSNGSFAKRNQQRKASWYTCCRVAKTYRMPYLGLGCVLQKSQPYNYWLFCGKRRDVACVNCDMSHHNIWCDISCEIVTCLITKKKQKIVTCLITTYGATYRVRL